MILLVPYLVLGIVLWPFAALAVLLHPRLRAHWRERLGLPVPLVPPGAVWLHAASVGEGRIVAAVAPMLGSAGLTRIRTYTSNTAEEQADGCDQRLALPIDSLPSVLAWLDRMRPRGLVLVEAELWPALLVGCRLRGIPVQRLAPREGPGMQRLRRVPGLVNALLAHTTTLHSTTDLKQLAPVGKPPFAWQGDALLAACTREGEEAMVLDAWSRMDPRPLLIVAPREPSRFNAVGAMLSARGARYLRRGACPARLPAHVEVVLLDSIGELPSLYGRARAAFVGGTFLPEVGGHSPAEAVAAGCPLVRGPHIAANAAAWAGAEAAVAATPEALPSALAQAWESPRTAVILPPALSELMGQMHTITDAPVPPERPLRPWLWPLAPLWWLGAALRPAPLAKAAIPVVSVGALTAGGTGKTPVAAWIAAALGGAAVVSRGYGRLSGGDVRTQGSAKELGDELAMLAQLGLRVVSSPDRVAGVAAAAKLGAPAAVLDDGLQVRTVARDLEVVVLDARWPGGGGPIPVGTRRLPWSWLAKADVVWVNHGPVSPEIRAAARPGAIFVEAQYRAVGWRRRGEVLPLSALPDRPAIAMAGVARPEGFFQLLRDLDAPVVHHAVFPDHHNFTWMDLQAIEAWLDDHSVLVTAKDAARLPEGLGVWSLLVELELLSGEPELRARLAALVPDRQ